MFDLQFAPVIASLPALLQGLWLTVKLSFIAIVCGASLGLIVAMLRSMAPPKLRWPANIYVELIRNTPFLVQLYIIFFGLPSFGVKVTAVEAGLLAMTINLGAYSTEIFRAGIDSIHRSQIEAAQALALTPLQIFRHIVLKPAVQKVWPSLVSQFVLIMLTSSVCSFISVEELSGAANTIQSATFRSFETYIIAGLMYLALAIVLKVGLFAAGSYIFGRRTRKPLLPASAMTSPILKDAQS
ncbi:amino acid ABC transporter permease [Phyllobacterium sp. SB3]|uniref:amino acid ABC transporter permease n=1 Tax=Phyllobacterium sp. SB3 TaxID=3156073 RepID=UPI0032AEEED0